MQSYEELEARVIRTGICTVCGACISACPLYYIQLIDEIPKRPKKKAACKECGVCFNACYRTKDEEAGTGIGSWIRVFSARMNEPQRSACQDGGVATAVMRYALSEGLIDGALLTGQEGWKPCPFIAKTSDDILSAARTKYGTSPLLAKLRPAIVEHGLDRIGLVGLPCHIRSTQNLRRQKIEPLGSAIALTVGLFCTGNLEYKYIEKEVKSLGMRMEEIEKFTVRDGYFNIHSSERIERIPLKREWILAYCPCKDYSGELADISVGSGVSPDSSTVIVRTDQGNRIIRGLEKSGILITNSLQDTGFLFRASEGKRNRTLQA